MEIQNSDEINTDFLKKIQRRQKERHTSFETLRQSCKLDEKATDIVSLTVFELLSKLRSRELSSSEVLRAYTAKALKVTENVNCVTEFVPQAGKWAEILDEQAKSKDATLGPLHGLPVAIKDDQDVEGMDTTMGFARNLYMPAKESAVIVQVLMKKGAVPFCKTNLPQSILTFGSDNPIYGIVRNGLRPDLAPGGSSSGSGSIVGAGGAPIATGSDLGGSLRCPSHYHGLSTLRGTTNRLSEKGMVEALPVITQRGVPGVIAPDAKTLAFLWKCLTEDDLQNELDPNDVPIPFNEKLFSSTAKLRIGYFSSLQFFPAFPDTQKTVLAARDALLAEGHVLVPFEMPDDYNYAKVIYNHLFEFTEEWLKEKFKGEPLATCMKDFITDLRAPKVEPPQDTSKMSARERVYADAFGKYKCTSGDDVLKIIYQKRAMTLDILGRMEDAGVDLILSPAYPHPAVKLEHGHKTMGAMVYTMIWNFVNFPTGVVRFGTETASSVANCDDQGDAFLKATKDALKDSAGMPINVQVIGKPFKEELVLRALCEIERLRCVSN